MNRLKTACRLFLTYRNHPKTPPARQKTKPPTPNPQWGRYPTALLSLAAVTLEDHLHQALDEGEASLYRLMDRLHHLVIEASNQYRDCLTRQIEATATGDGDAVTRWRIRANEVKAELDEYWIVLRVLGEVDLKAVLDEAGAGGVAAAFRRVESEALGEFEANRRKELELLEAQYSRIVEDS